MGANSLRVQFIGYKTMGAMAWVHNNGCKTMGAKQWVLIPFGGKSFVGAKQWVQNIGC